MAVRQNRYKALYEGVAKASNASTFPRHVFMRAQNLHTNIFDRIGDR